MLLQEWVPDRACRPAEDTYPRLLTADEIREILSIIDKIDTGGVGDKILLEVKRNFKYDIYKQMTNPKAKCSVTSITISFLQQRIVVKYYQTKAEHGLQCGHIGTTSISSSTIQGTMNTFKQLSGASGSFESSIRNLTSLLYAHDRKQYLATIMHFSTNPPVSKSDVLDMRCELLEIKLDKIVVDWEVNYLSPTADVTYGYMKRYYWHTIHEIRNNEVIPTDRKVLRLMLNCSTMFYHQVLPEDVAKAILHATEYKGVIVAFSPFNTGIVVNDVKVCIVDVIIVPNSISNGRSEEGQTTFLMKEIFHKKSDIYIKGIKGLTELYPVTYEYRSMIEIGGVDRYIQKSNVISEFEPQLSMIKESLTQRIVDTLDNNYVLFGVDSDTLSANYSSIRDFKTSNPDARIVGSRDSMYVIATTKPLSFSSGSTIEIRDLDFDHLTTRVEYPVINRLRSENDDVDDNLWLLPMQTSNVIINDSLFPAYKQLTEYLNENNMTVVAHGLHPINGKILSYLVYSKIDPVDILNGAKMNKEYCYAIAKGGDYNQIIRLAYLDPLRTIPNNIHRITSTIGCEASRRYLLYELNQILGGEGNDVNSRHMSVIADLIYLKGISMGATFPGNVARGQGPITLATEEKGGTVLKSAANNRAFESTASVSTSIITGQEPYIGERASSISMSEEQAQLSLQRHKEKLETKRKLRSNLVVTAEAVKARNATLMKTILSSIPSGIPEAKLEPETPSKDISLSTDTGVQSQFRGLTPSYVVPASMVQAAKTVNPVCDLRFDTTNVITATSTPNHNISSEYYSKKFVAQSFYDKLLTNLRPTITNNKLRTILPEYTALVIKRRNYDENVGQLSSMVPTLQGKAHTVSTIDSKKMIDGSVILDIPFPTFNEDANVRIDVENIMRLFHHATSIITV